MVNCPDRPPALGRPLSGARLWLLLPPCTVTLASFCVHSLRSSRSRHTGSSDMLGSKAAEGQAPGSGAGTSRSIDPLRSLGQSASDPCDPALSKGETQRFSFMSDHFIAIIFQSELMSVCSFNLGFDGNKQPINLGLINRASSHGCAAQQQHQWSHWT